MATAASRPRRIELKEGTPRLYAAVARLDRLTKELGLDPALRDLVKIRASQINGCQYCLGLHAAETLERGESTERIDAVSQWRDSTLFSDRERAGLAFAEALTQLPAVDDEIYTSAQQGLWAGAKVSGSVAASLLRKAKKAGDLHGGGPLVNNPRTGIPDCSGPRTHTSRGCDQCHGADVTNVTVRDSPMTDASTEGVGMGGRRC